MPDPKVCAACGNPGPDTDDSDDLYVCAACLGLHDQLAAPPPEPVPSAPEPAAPPVARRVVETPPPAETPAERPATRPSLRHTMRWRVIADGYRDLRFALLTLLISVPLSVGVRFVERFTAAPRRGYGQDPSEFMSIGSLVFSLLAFVAVVKFLSGAVALAKKPCDVSEKWLPWMLCISAFIPVVNLVAFPLLLTLYTHGVGVDLGKRSVTRSAGILFGCSLVLVPPVLFAVKVLFDLVVDRSLDGPPLGPTNPNPEPVAAEVLFGVGAGAILWLGAYVVTVMLLSGVARAIENRLREGTAPNDPESHFAQLKDTLRPGENQSAPT